MIWNFIRIVLPGICLLLEGIRDLKKRKISIAVITVFAVLGILIQLPVIKENGFNMLAGTFIGLGILFLAQITNEKIGYGDGIILIVTGIYLGFKSNFILLLSSLMLAAVISVILLISKKANRKTELPMVSFMFVAYVFLCITNYSHM